MMYIKLQCQPSTNTCGAQMGMAHSLSLSRREGLFSSNETVNNCAFYLKTNMRLCTVPIGSNLIPPSTFHHRDTRRGRSFHRHVVGMPPCRIGSSFLMLTANEWTVQPAIVFTDQYNLENYLQSRPE